MQSPQKKQRLLTFASGGWVLLLTGIFTVVVLAIVLVPVLRMVAQRPPGDGRDPRSYGFDLAAATVPVETIVPAMAFRDNVRPLDAPALMPGGAVEVYNAEIRGKYVVPDDLVAGVQIGGEARAYPLSVLSFHEAVNDTLAGVPIAISCSPLSGSVAAFERKVNEEVVEFGISGLVHDSTHLLYDRRGGSGESLWDPLAGRAMAGPAAGESLVRLPVTVMRWSDWLQRYPDTTLPKTSEAMMKRHRELRYDAYERSPELRFPVEPLPPQEGAGGERLLKTPCIVVFAGDEHRLYAIPELLAAGEAAQPDAAHRLVRDEIGGRAVTLHVTRGPMTAWATLGDDGPPAVAVYTFWFAWFAHQDSPGAASTASAAAAGAGAGP